MRANLHQTVLRTFLVVLLFLSCITLLFQGCKQHSKSSTILTTNKDSIADWIATSRNNSLTIAQRELLLQKASQTIEKLALDTTKTRQLSALSLAYSKLGDSAAFRKWNKQTLNLSHELGDQLVEGEAHWDLGFLLENNGIKDSAYYHYREAYLLFKNIPLLDKQKVYPGRMLHNMGSVQEDVKDYVGAEKNIVEAIRFYKTLPDTKEQLSSSYNLLGAINGGLKKYALAISYYQKAKGLLPAQDSINLSSSWVSYQNNIAAAYNQLGEYTTALKGFNAILAEPKVRKEYPRTYALTTTTKAHILYKLEGAATNVAPLYKEAFFILDSLNDTYYQARPHQYYAEYLAAKQDTIAALGHAYEAKKLAEASSNNHRLLKTLVVLSQLDKPNSAKHSQEYFELSEKLQDEERSFRDKFALIELETEEVIQENEDLLEQRRKWAVISAGLILLALAAFIILMQRASNQRLRFEQSQQKSNAEIYDLMLSQHLQFEEGKKLEQKRISEELHDGILGEMLGIRLILSKLNSSEAKEDMNYRAQLLEQLRGVEEEVRSISHELSDNAYQKINNFIQALSDMIEKTCSAADIPYTFDYTEGQIWGQLDGEAKINTYRIVQEGLQNSIKHAECQHIKIELQHLGEVISLKLSDDGKGFDTKKKKGGIGMRNISSRVDKMNGELSVESKANQGTIIKVRIPFNPSKRQNNPLTTKQKTSIEA